jgi:ABC-type sugar transport system permease subunit
MHSSSLYKRIVANRVFYLAIAPFFVLFGLFSAYPIAMSLYYSFTRWDGFTTPQFIGWKNYISLFNDPYFVQAIGHTLELWIGSTVLTLSLAFFLAYLLNHYVMVWRYFFQIGFMFPLLMAPSMTAILASVLFAVNGGLANTVLGFFAGHQVTYDWMNADAGFWIKPIVVLMVVWRWTGWNTIIFLTGFQTISPDLYEAARVDGASNRQAFFHIALPLMIPVILFATVTSTIGSLQIFDEPYVLTLPTGGTGGVFQAGNSLAMYLYNAAFTDFKFGLASATSYIMFAFIVFFAVLNFRMLRSQE